MMIELYTDLYAKDTQRRYTAVYQDLSLATIVVEEENGVVLHWEHGSYSGRIRFSSVAHAVEFLEENLPHILELIIRELRETARSSRVSYAPDPKQAGQVTAYVGEKPLATIFAPEHQNQKIIVWYGDGDLSVKEFAFFHEAYQFVESLANTKEVRRKLAK